MTEDMKPFPKTPISDVDEVDHSNRVIVLNRHGVVRNVRSDWVGPEDTLLGAAVDATSLDVVSDGSVWVDVHEHGMENATIRPDPKLLFRVMRMHDDVTMPKRHSKLASGYDIHAYIKQPVTLQPRQRTLIGTGLCLRIPEGLEVQVRPRSGLSNKHGIIIPNAPGTVDADYHGELMVGLLNLSSVAFVIQPDMRIAQMVLCPIDTRELQEVPYETPSSERGDGGFGSTGQ